MDKETIAELKVLGAKFIKGFIAGFLGVAATFLVPNVATLKDLSEWLFALGLASLVGAISGGLQAMWKAITWKTDEELLAEINARVAK